MKKKYILTIKKLTSDKKDEVDKNFTNDLLNKILHKFYFVNSTDLHLMTFALVSKILICFQLRVKYLTTNFIFVNGCYQFKLCDFVNQNWVRKIFFGTYNDIKSLIEIYSVEYKFTKSFWEILFNK